MTHIMLAHAPEEEARAALIARKLGERGYEVRQAANGFFTPGPISRRKRTAEIDKASCVVLLWSRDAAEAPVLHETAQRARDAGKLAVARLDAAAIPPGLRPARTVNLSAWSGRETARPWLDLTSAIKSAGAAPARSGKPAAAPARGARAPAQAAAPAAAAEPKKQGQGGAVLAVILLLALAVGAAGYFFLL